MEKGELLVRMGRRVFLVMLEYLVSMVPKVNNVFINIAFGIDLFQWVILYYALAL